MLDKELKKKLFLKKKKEETDFVDFQHIASPKVQLTPFLDRLNKGFRAKLQENNKKQQEILNRLPTQSKETARQFVLNQKAADHFLLSLFEKACSRAQPVPSQQLEDQISENYKSKQDQAFSQAEYSYDSKQFEPPRHSSSILEKYRGFYQRPYRIHDHKRAQKFRKHPKLFFALAENLEILLKWLQSKDINLVPKLEYVLPYRLEQVQYNKDSLKDTQQWLKQKFKQEYVMIMPRGDNCLQSLTIPMHQLNKENPFRIKDYLSGKDQKDVVDYFLQVCRALTELIRCKIYHMDIEPRNIIPKTNEQGKVEYKLIDFEISLFLATAKAGVHTTLTKIWSLAKQYWLKKDYQIVHSLFDQKMLCQKHQIVCQLFKNDIRAPCAGLYDYLLVEQQDSEKFIQYLLRYMVFYYRNALLEILGEIMEKRKWLNEHYEQLKKIITRQPFQNIDLAIYSLWSNRF